jgi:NUMOD4 motif
MTSDHYHPEEHWAPIPGWHGFYEVSNRGRVRSVDREVTRTDGQRHRFSGRILRQQPGRGGPSVVLQRPGGRRHVCVHKLVEAAFGDEAAA